MGAEFSYEDKDGWRVGKDRGVRGGKDRNESDEEKDKQTINQTDESKESKNESFLRHDTDTSHSLTNT